MSWIVGSLLVVAGMVLGFFLARYWLQNHSDSSRLNDEVTQSKEQLAQYQREVAEHFATANALVKQLADTQAKLQSYLNHSADILQRSDDDKPLPFFSEDTIRQLRVANTVNRDSRSDKHDAGEHAPRDYAGSASGLLKGEQKHK